MRRGSYRLDVSCETWYVFVRAFSLAPSPNKKEKILMREKATKGGQERWGLLVFDRMKVEEEIPGEKLAARQSEIDHVFLSPQPGRALRASKIEHLRVFLLLGLKIELLRILEVESVKWP